MTVKGSDVVRRFFQVLGWLLLFAIIVLTVVPPQERPVTPAPHDVEHLSIFLLTGLAFGLGYARRYFVQILALVLFAAAIEMIQLAIPGRHSRLSDFVVDAFSVSIGVGLAVILEQCKIYWTKGLVRSTSRIRTPRFLAPQSLLIGGLSGRAPAPPCPQEGGVRLAPL